MRTAHNRYCAQWCIKISTKIGVQGSSLKRSPEIGSPVGAHSGRVWRAMSECLGGERRISRTSVYFFLDGMADRGVLGYRVATEKGGKHRIYYPLLNEKGFVLRIIDDVFSGFIRDFPVEVREVIEKYQT